MKHILMATDLSERSAPAMARAFELAFDQAATLTILHAIDPDLPRDMRAQLQRLARIQLGKDAAQLAQHHGCSFDIRVVESDPSDAARLQAQAVDADLIVLGTHRARAFFDTLRDTTMERIVRASDVPVLLVRDAPTGRYGRVLCPVDFSNGVARALGAAQQMLPGAEFRLFHAFRAPHPVPGGGDRQSMPFRKMIAQEYTAWIAAHGEIAHLGAPDVAEGSITAITASELTAFRPDLMVLGTHSRGRLQRVSVGAFARDMIRNPPVDLLISPP